MRLARRARSRALLIVLACASPLPSTVAQVVIYRCTDAGGAVTLQNGTPCPKGTRQQKRVLDTPAPAAPPVAPVVTAPPLAAPAAPPVAPEPISEPEHVVEAPRQPPPALFQCTTWDKERYFGEDAQPPARCAPMQVTGLDGTGANAGGVACQMIEDRCQPVIESRLCDAWVQRLREAESTARFGDMDKRAQADADAERSRQVLARSLCPP